MKIVESPPKFFTAFARNLPENVASLYLIGAAAEPLAAALDAAGRAYSRDGDLVSALAHARADAQPGDIVLLSPATASSQATALPRSTAGASALRSRSWPAACSASRWRAFAWSMQQSVPWSSCSIRCRNRRLFR